MELTTSKIVISQNKTETTIDYIKYLLQKAITYYGTLHSKNQITI